MDGPWRPNLNEKFVAVADRVSFGMGTPSNIILWVVAVAVWFALFALGLMKSTGTWFTSPEFNFPLNTVTTLAELYIGFLVAAAANRVESHQRHQLEHIESLNAKILELLEQHHD